MICYKTALNSPLKFISVENTGNFEMNLHLKQDDFARVQIRICCFKETIISSPLYVQSFISQPTECQKFAKIEISR